jgi:hypothetical protein
VELRQKDKTKIFQENFRVSEKNSKAKFSKLKYVDSSDGLQGKFIQNTRSLANNKTD